MTDTHFISRSPIEILFPILEMKTLMALQQQFNSNDKNLNLLNASGELDSYVVNTVESNEATYSHCLTYHEVSHETSTYLPCPLATTADERTKIENKSFHERLDILQDEMGTLLKEWTLERGTEIMNGVAAPFTA